MYLLSVRTVTAKLCIRMISQVYFLDLPERHGSVNIVRDVYDQQNVNKDNNVTNNTTTCFYRNHYKFCLLTRPCNEQHLKPFLYGKSGVCIFFICSKQTIVGFVLIRLLEADLASTQNLSLEHNSEKIS